MSNHFIFGYGSLVNRATHDYGTTYRARIKGWRRVWQKTSQREVAFLNVVPDPRMELDGLIMEVPRTAPDLDAREFAYSKHDVTRDVIHQAPMAHAINLFTITPDNKTASATKHALLLSYIDVVVAGYLDLFGPTGAAGFFATTSGWDVDVWDDRAAPLYPRAQPLHDEVRALVDTALLALPCNVVGVPDA